MKPELIVENLSYAIGGRSILKDLSFTLGTGECVALLGANGAGKTTLLRILLRLQASGGGNILLRGKPLAVFPQRELARAIAYVPQSHTPPFPYRVKDIVMMGRLAQVPFGARRPKSDWHFVEQALETLAIRHLAEQPYDQISGGERQAALIARALAQEARILILDEPETGLDFGQQQRLFGILQRLSDEGYAVLATTHDPFRARQVYQRAVLLHQGRVMADGPVQHVLTDAAIRRLYKLGPAQSPGSLRAVGA